MSASAHDWRAVVQYRLTGAEARQLVEGYGHPEVDQAPVGMLAGDERPAAGDPRVFLGTHNLLAQETMVICWHCENGWSAELAAEPCRGEAASPLSDLAGTFASAPGPLGNVPEGNLSANVGRNDPCPCGSGQKFKRCHGAR
jgi:hypothetical protein